MHPLYLRSKRRQSHWPPQPSLPTPRIHLESKRRAAIMFSLPISHLQPLPWTQFHPPPNPPPAKNMGCKNISYQLISYFIYFIKKKDKLTHSESTFFSPFLLANRRHLGWEVGEWRGLRLGEAAGVGNRSQVWPLLSFPAWQTSTFLGKLWAQRISPGIQAGLVKKWSQHQEKKPASKILVSSFSKTSECVLNFL